MINGAIDTGRGRMSRSDKLTEVSSFWFWAEFYKGEVFSEGVLL